ncbi:hypothetical protein ACWIUD_10160 [Helicobacter sp. 23-1044]
MKIWICRFRFCARFCDSHEISQNLAKKSQNLAMTDKNTPLRHCEAHEAKRVQRSNPKK